MTVGVAAQELPESVREVGVRAGHPLQLRDASVGVEVGDVRLGLHLPAVAVAVALALVAGIWSLSASDSRPSSRASSTRSAHLPPHRGPHRGQKHLGADPAGCVFLDPAPE